MRDSRPRRRSPAAASTSPLTSAPWSSLRSRVSTLPRIGGNAAPRIARASCATRLTLLVPIAGAGPSRLSAWAQDPAPVPAGSTSASPGFSRSSVAASVSPAGSAAGMSLLLCTAMSTEPASSASSISLTNRPLPPASRKDTSASRSPEVLISTISHGTPQRSASSAATVRACTSASWLPRVPIRNLWEFTIHNAQFTNLTEAEGSLDPSAVLSGPELQFRKSPWLQWSF